MTLPTSDEARCSRLWQRDDLPAWGTASRATFWVALEQPGPWGAKALTQSHLDPELGARLDELCSRHGGRAVLVRRPGRHHDAGQGTRQVFVAGGLAVGQAWLGSRTISDVTELLDWLEPATPTLAEATQRPSWLAAAAPIVAVCANGRRDQCCALEGRALAQQLAAMEPDATWESSHLGGHRFAPTALVLPTGQSLARLTPTLAMGALVAAERGWAFNVGPHHDRGLSALAPEQQVADAWARAEGLDSWQVEASNDQATPNSWQVRAGDRRATITLLSGPEELPSSCGKDAVPLTRYVVEEADHG